MNDGGTLRCIGCRQFTVAPRSALHLVDQDEKMAALGMGRCSKDKTSGNWYSANFARRCEQYLAVDAADLAKRTKYMGRIRSA